MRTRGSTVMLLAAGSMVVFHVSDVVLSQAAAGEPTPPTSSSKTQADQPSSGSSEGTASTKGKGTSTARPSGNGGVGNTGKTPGSEHVRPDGGQKGKSSPKDEKSAGGEKK